ncbi:unnamed protein product [Coffea canephora]|uniref:Uncharacterized protein n=1 Tax=Coffea canephora TaxID=49390 RepID=A0A068U9P3_COFCA|nr:unnamed protein product [Coffea canephora]
MDCRPSPTAAAGAEEAGGEAPPPTTYRIGYALSPKKVESFIQPSLLNLAKQRHIHLLPIDLHKPLSHQGPFDCLLHKLSGPDWTQQLRHFSSLHPDVPIIDPPDAVLRLHDRLSMLQVVRDLHLPEPIDESDSSSSSSCSFGIPHQEEEEAAQMPPVSFLARLAKALRNALGLHLFNFDVIRDGRFGNRYLVIDINYFPGYAKMPSYETVLTDFFLDLLRRKQQQ